MPVSRTTTRHPGTVAPPAAQAPGALIQRNRLGEERVVKGVELDRGYLRQCGKGGQRGGVDLRSEERNRVEALPDEGASRGGAAPRVGRRRIAAHRSATAV